ncbi:TPA: tryptophan--tRNA ligase, partial [Candidatus Saccharibacteria bacterium]|nr:tryptophan--tRNA ligase [Candidatus Saccharibacteria bacterium]
LALLTTRTQDEVNAEWDGKTSYGDLKKAVAEAVQAFLETFQARYNEVGKEALISKLEASEEAMNIVANETLARVQAAVGLRPKA